MSKSKVTGAWSGKSPHKPGPRFHRHAKLSDVRRAQRRGELTFAEWRQQQRKNLDNNLIAHRVSLIRQCFECVVTMKPADQTTLLLLDGFVQHIEKAAECADGGDFVQAKHHRDMATALVSQWTRGRSSGAQAAARRTSCC